MMLYKVLMHYIDCDTIQVVPWSSCSRYQRVFTYRRGSLWRYRSLLIIKSRYLMDMSPLHHVVRLYDITSCSWCLSSLHHNGNVTHTLTSDLKIYVSGKFYILSGRIVNCRYCILQKRIKSWSGDFGPGAFWRPCRETSIPGVLDRTVKFKSLSLIYILYWCGFWWTDPPCRDVSKIFRCAQQHTYCRVHIGVFEYEEWHDHDPCACQDAHSFLVGNDTKDTFHPETVDKTFSAHFGSPRPDFRTRENASM